MSSDTSSESGRNNLDAALSRIGACQIPQDTGVIVGWTIKGFGGVERMLWALHESGCVFTDSQTSDVLDLVTVLDVIRQEQLLRRRR